MPKLRRFRVDSLAGLSEGAQVALPAREAHHARVLRLEPGAEVILLDGSGAVRRARLEPGGACATLLASTPGASPLPADAAPACAGGGTRLILATAWPKGKRAAVLVEKCTELGVAQIVPLRWDRSVVVKDAGSAGWERLQRIAGDAAKQSGRPDVPLLSETCSFASFLASAPAGRLTVLLDARAPRTLHGLLEEQCSPGAPFMEVCVCVGPEGGISPAEGALAGRAGWPRARLAQGTLRVETAALAACAVWAQWAAREA